jgi:hypothetical protein
MSLKHGIYWKEFADRGDECSFYWMGEFVTMVDFNERLIAQTKSVAKDVDMLQMGMDLKDSINEGQKTVAQLDELEKIAKLPLCKECRKLIGEVQQ